MPKKKVALKTNAALETKAALVAARKAGGNEVQSHLLGRLGVIMKRRAKGQKGD